jgi:hypothetical protein
LLNVLPRLQEILTVQSSSLNRHKPWSTTNSREGPHGMGYVYCTQAWHFAGSRNWTNRTPISSWQQHVFFFKTPAGSY